MTTVPASARCATIGSPSSSTILTTSSSCAARCMLAGAPVGVRLRRDALEDQEQLMLGEPCARVLRQRAWGCVGGSAGVVIVVARFGRWILMRRVLAFAAVVAVVFWLPDMAAAFTVNTSPCLRGGVRSVDPNPLPGCWFLGDAGLSCSSVCAANGLVYDDLTRTIAGSEGSDFNCNVLLDALNAPTIVVNTCTLGLGCELEGNQPTRCTSPTTTATDSSPTSRRVCACVGQPAPTLSFNGLGLTTLLLMLAGGLYVGVRSRRATLAIDPGGRSTR